LRVPHLPFFLNSFAWNIGLGMTWLPVPLYAHAQGLSSTQIGALFAVPVLVQTPLNLLGGAYTDRIGGRSILIGSSAALILTGVWFIFAEGFWMLMLGQLVMVLARAAFWPATWSMASELPGVRSVQFGRLNAVTNVGQIGGTALSGFLLAGAGFPAAFGALAAVGVISTLAALGTQRTTHPATVSVAGVFDAYRPLLRQPLILYTVMCAYLSAVPFSLGTSFYPLLLADYGHGEEVSGVVISLRAIGSIAASLLVARLVRTGPEAFWPVACGIAVAVGVGLSPTINHVVPIGLWILLIGAGSAAMTLYFQVTISEASRPEGRGAALALGGVGWGLSHLTTPLLIGFIADRHGLVAGFYALGVVCLLFATTIAFMRRWAFAARA